MKPNLFQYATSELSQDAILWWLLSWADNKHRILEECSRHGLKAKRPNRVGKGDYMTVAILDQDFRLVNERNLIDLPRTIVLLRKAEFVLDDMKAQQALGADLASSAAQA